MIAALKARVSNLISSGDAPTAFAPESELMQTRIRDNVVASLLSKVGIRNITRSLVFNVTVESESPVLNVIEN